MAENRKLTQKDIDVIGFRYEDVAKGTAALGAYQAIRGYIQEFSYRVDDDRKEHNRSGDGPMQSDQSIGQRKVSGRLHYKVNQDFESGDGSTESMLYYALGKDSMLDTTDGRIFPRGTKYIAFDNGPPGGMTQNEPTLGKTLDDSSTNTAILMHTILSSGAWGDNDAAGYLIIDKVLGVFADNDVIEQGATDIAACNGANKEIGPELESFTIWCRQKNFDDDSTYDHVVEGVHIQKLNIRGLENGDVEFDIEFKAIDLSHTAPGASTLPSQPYTKGGAFFKWTSADASVFTITRAGSEARVKTWDITIDNGDLHFVPKAGQAYAADFIPGMLNITGNLEFFVNDTELYTIWYTDPNTDKTLTYGTLAGGTFTNGQTISNTTQTATAFIVSDNGTTSMTVRRVQGQFTSGDAIVSEDGAVTATLTANMTDTSTIDFELVLSKETNAQYLKFDFYNVVPTGSMEFSHNPNEDAPWMLRYPFKVLRTHNFVCDVRP